MATNDKFKDILYELITSAYDSQPTKNEEYAKQLSKVHDEFVERNKKLTGLLDDYILERKNRMTMNKKLKTILFVVFVLLLLALTFALINVYLRTDINKAVPSSVVSLFSVMITYLGSILSIFKIMSKYLFPVDEEKDTLDMIKTVISNDITVEELMLKSIKENDDNNIILLKKYKELLDQKIITNEEFDRLKNKFLGLNQTKK